MRMWHTACSHELNGTLSALRNAISQSSSGYQGEAEPCNEARWQENGYRQRISEKVSASCSTPAATKARRERAIAMRLNELGTEAARDPAGNARKRERISATKMSWCPPELIEEARRLRAMRFSAAEVKRIILDQHERDMARFRASIGAESRHA